MAGRPARKSFSERRKLSLHDFREQAIEAQSQIASLILVGDNGEEFEIPHPMLISDEAQHNLNRVQAGDDLDKNEAGEVIEPVRIDGKFPEPLSTRIARALLGPEEHARFVAAGGHSHDVSLAWNKMVAEQKELLEQDPK